MKLTVALLGNPNTGKSTLFSAIAGIPTRIGNYPGVTVEEKVGTFLHRGHTIELIDLPGAYSLNPKSPDEQVAVDVLCGNINSVAQPDCIVVVVDATNLSRNLYLVSQALAVGRPVLVALTLCDVAESKGIHIDRKKLSEFLGCPVLRLVAPRRDGVDQLADALIESRDWSGQVVPKALNAYLSKGAESDRPVAAADAIARYSWIDDITKDVLSFSTKHSRSLGERIDAVLTHRILGTVVFGMTMLSIFSSIFWLATPLMDLVSGGVELLAGWAELVMPDGILQSLVVNGIIAGVGGVVIFLPQIAILFLFVAVLEGCGYLARAAFLMDRLLVGVGLSGKSFIPLLSSFACAIPGIMAARTIENKRDRLLTILVAPLMSCSARLPVYLLLCSAFVPNVAVGNTWFRLPAVVLASMYLIGIFVAAIVAFVLSRTIFRGPPQPFVLELPSWRWPQPAVVGERVREAAVSFLKNAGTLILAVSIVVWALGSFPKPVIQAGVNPVSAEQQGEALRQSFLGQAGRFIEPVVKPLGWDWRIGCAAVASFPAREVVLGVLGVIYNLGDVDPGEEEGAGMLIRQLRSATWDGTDRKVFTLPVALSIMVFFALCAQCASTLVIIGKETASWVWPLVSFTYMTALAWIGAFCVFQLGTTLGW
ncbi:MAG: ferrous iron transport protein B [Planctomycetaceae bacterium]|nr:ferrous iron transport protein B [Planctomycetaceae bacterium]MBT4159322.1 ferrous iron transport protein B [Planctomycetaceae bacterium]MBT6055083.1 ferrous iron transport protein B [Planctomycetaceae bacterium]MBT6643192.1 ferrous iron transport protein B [Planctomycetaceae bacterium]MBT7729113.1 ferrous iron transport protein B [Planctomycetaceae bacterium]